MKKLILILFLGLSLPTWAQSENTSSDTKTKVKTKGGKAVEKCKCQKAYFDLSTGINNNGGLISVGGDVHVSEDFSINGGAGISSWGYKMYLGGKYYMKPCHRGWAFGGGLTYSSGIAEYTADLETYGSGPSGKEEVTLELLPQVNMFAAAYRYWNLGKNNNRIYLQLGWSFAFTTDKFNQLTGSSLTQSSANIMRFTSPGGVIAAVGFSFTGHK